MQQCDSAISPDRVDVFTRSGMPIDEVQRVKQPINGVRPFPFGINLGFGGAGFQGNRVITVAKT